MILVTILSAAILVNILPLLLLIRQQELRKALAQSLQSIQIQLAFVSGRIGLRNRDLEAQVPLTKEPEGNTDAEGFTEWNEAAWMLARAEEEAGVAEGAGER